MQVLQQRKSTAASFLVIAQLAKKFSKKEPKWHLVPFNRQTNHITHTGGVEAEDRV